MRPDHRLASGPGNLGTVLGLKLTDDGAPLGDEFVFWSPPAPSRCRSNGPRTGISVAVDWPLRFWIIGDPTVSPYRRTRSRGWLKNRLGSIV